MIHPKLEISVDGSSVVLTDTIKSFKYEETNSGSSVYLIRGSIGEDKWSLFDKFINNIDTKATIKWGYSEGKGKDHWSSSHSILCGTAKYRYALPYIEYLIEGFDLGYRLKEICSKPVYKDKLISEIVSEIANSNGLSSKITPTTGKFHLMSCGMCDAKFIRNELLQRAYNGTGYPYVFYFDNGNTLVFAPVESSKEFKSYDDIMSYGFYRSNQAHYAEDLSIEYRMVNIYKREYKKFVVDDGVAKYPMLSHKKINPPGKPGAAIASEYYEKEEEFKGVSKARWSVDCMNMFDFILKCREPEVSINKIITINAKDPNKAPTVASGKYVVTKNVVDISGGSYFNYVYMSRRTF